MFVSFAAKLYRKFIPIAFRIAHYKPLTEPRPVYVGFVVDRLKLGQDFLRVLRYSPTITMTQDTAVGIATRS